jgi:hypothetical protein
LELSSIEQGEFTTGTWGVNIAKGTIGWTDHDADSHDGVFATLVFHVKDNAPAGDYTVTATYDEDDVFNQAGDNVYFDVIPGKVTVAAAETAYYLVGSMTNWQVDAAYKLSRNTAQTGAEEYYLDVNLAQGALLKIVKATGTNIETWYPDGMDNNYTVDYAHSGDVVVYFRPSANSSWNNFHEGGFFYISKLHTVVIEIDPAGSGSATISPEQPDWNATVTLSATPNDGYHYDHTEIYQKTSATTTQQVNLSDMNWNDSAKTFTMPDYDIVIKVYFAAHSWGTPTYEWAEDNSTCTATHTCAVCGLTETETVNTTYAVTTPPTTTTVGEGTYTATFTKQGFEQQTKTVVIPKIPTTVTIAYVDFRHGVTLQFDVLQITDGEEVPTPEFREASYANIYTYDDCRYDPDDMWTTSVSAFVTGDAVYVLKWINVYTVTFLDDSGVTLKTVKVDENGTIPANEIPTAEGCIYTWYEDSLPFDLNTTITRNVTLQAKVKVNVTIDPNNGDESYVVPVEKGATMSEPEQPINGDKVFAGWFNGDTEFDFSTQITAPITLTAHWNERPTATIGTRIEFADGAVQYNGTTPYVIWSHNAGIHEPAFTVVGEDDTVLTRDDYTFEYKENNKPGTGYIVVTMNEGSQYLAPAYRWFKIYLPASESLTVENVADGIRLTWAPVEDAAGYVIYRRAWSTTTNGWTSFERWYNVTGVTEWKDGFDNSHKVYAGTRYQYGVKAFFAERNDGFTGDSMGGGENKPSGNYNLGIVSPLKTTVRITTRTLTAVTSKDGKLTVKWAGSKVFTGYEVEVATDAAFESIVKTETIANAATYSKVFEGLTVGTTYYVRIRSYHMFENTKYYGGWSEVKNNTLQ